MTLFRLVNYGPELARLVRHNIVAQTPSEMFHFIPTSSAGGSASEWDFYNELGEGGD